MMTMESRQSIRNAASACRQELEECLDIKDLKQQEWAENRLADFNLWASGVGALADGKMSLDLRLAPRPDAKAVVEDLLHFLAEAIRRCISTAKNDPTERSVSSDSQTSTRGRPTSPTPPQPPPRSFSPWSDASSDGYRTGKDSNDTTISTSTPLSRSMREVCAMLDTLSRVSIVLRRSSTRSRLQKADHRFDTEEHKELHQHLAVILLSRGLSGLTNGSSSLQIDAAKLTPTQHRLIYCNLKRRNRFLYAQRHSKALDTVEEFKSPPSTDHKLPSTSPEHSSQKHDLEEVSPASPATDQHNLPTTMETSASGVTDLPMSFPRVPGSSLATGTQLSETVARIDYPAPPELHDGMMFFRCPCCCQVLPEVFATGSHWKKHLEGDLQPYTCISDNCLTPHELYPTRQAWERHLLEAHGSTDVWACLACPDYPEFERAQDFVDHTAESHKATIPESQISALESICKRTVPKDINLCPLCDHSNAGINRGSQTSLDHIAEHIHSFSLRSLPWGADTNQPSRAVLNHAARIVGTWLERPDISFENQMLVPTTASQYHYFNAHEYFGDDADRSHKTTCSKDTIASALQNEMTESWPPSQSTPLQDDSRLASDRTRPRLSEMIVNTIIQNIDGAAFVPSNVRDILGIQNIIQALFRSVGDDDQLTSVVRYVLVKPALKIFLLLICCNLERDISFFFSTGLCDDNLPLLEVKVDGQAGFQAVLGESTQWWPAPSSWSALERAEFLSHQWVFTAPVFTSDRFIYRLDERCPLPFVDTLKSVERAESEMNIEVHDAHQRDKAKNGEKVWLHRKSLHPQDGLSFDDLEQKFSSLQAIDDSHLIKPVASCRILRNNHPLHGYFLLPRAEGGDLRDFWARQTTEPLSDQRLMKWVLNQTRGLCNALSVIYQRGDCHGDIRPENILLFSEGGYKGTLRITFGGSPASDRQNRYVPPELVDGDDIPLHLIGSAALRNLIDVWCLGCVYVELLIWILYGTDGLSVFDRSGAIYFWGRRDGEVIVHPLIQDWLNRLSRDLTGPKTALSDLLSVVKSDMLVPNLRSRINSIRVHERLVRISEKSSAEEKYLLNPNTRRNIITRLSVLPLADMARASPPPPGTGNRRSG